MSSAKHTHSLHIDAPVEKVFGYLEDPAHFLATYPEKNQVTLESVNRNPDGTVASYQSKYRPLSPGDWWWGASSKASQTGTHLTADWTREEYVPNERILDRNSMGILFTWTVQADGAGTTLTVSGDAPKLMKMLDAAFFHMDKKEADELLAKVKQAVEALP